MIGSRLGQDARKRKNSREKIAIAATALVALVFSILTGSTLGIIGYGLLMAVTDTLIDETPVEKANKFWGI